MEFGWVISVFESDKEYLSNRDSTFTVYVAECPEVGTVSQGDTIEGDVNNLKEATELYLDEFPLKEVRKTLMTTFEVAVGVEA